MLPPREAARNVFGLTESALRTGLPAPGGGGGGGGGQFGGQPGGGLVKVIVAWMATSEPGLFGCCGESAGPPSTRSPGGEAKTLYVAPGAPYIGISPVTPVPWSAISSPFLIG